MELNYVIYKLQITFISKQRNAFSLSFKMTQFMACVALSRTMSIKLPRNVPQSRTYILTISSFNEFFRCTPKNIANHRLVSAAFPIHHVHITTFTLLFIAHPFCNVVIVVYFYASLYII